MATAGASRGSGPERAYASVLPATGEVRLDPEESSHLVRARRVRVGEAVVLFDGQGGSRLGRLADANAKAALVHIDGDYPDRRPSRVLRLAVALPEMGRADRMVQALAELGVAELAPLVTVRSAPGRAGQAERRAPRWAKLAREACKVNGCARALELRPALPFEDALVQGAVLLDPDPAAAPLLEVLGAAGESAWLLVGPEGGFTEAELGSAREGSAPVARLGATALRVETAAIAAAAIALGT